MLEVAQTQQEIHQRLAQWVLEHPRGRFPGEPDRRLFSGPLLGVAWGADPLFRSFREIIGPFHRLPVEFLQAAFPGETFWEEQVWVICYVLPIEKLTRLANSRQKKFPHRHWMLTKIHGEGFNEWLRARLVQWISQKGYRAVAPVLHPGFLQFPLVSGEITSNWSERHACFAAGLGTFGLNRGLITQAGMASRLGTVITDLPLEATPKSYGSPYEFCLFLSRGECGRCMERCPAKAVSPQGQDKLKCQAYQMDVLKRKGPSLGLGSQISGLHLSCGLCQTGVPCEDRPPSLKRGLPQQTGRAHPTFQRVRLKQEA